MSAETPRQVGTVTTATATGAAAVMVICWLLETLTGIKVPTEVQGAATVVVVAVAGWLVKPGSGSRRADPE